MVAYTPAWMCGFETGIVATYGVGVSDATRVTIQTTTKRSGAYGAKIAASATNDRLWFEYGGATRMIAYVRFSAVPGTDMMVFHNGQISGNDHRSGIGIRGATGNWATFHRDGTSAEFTWGDDGDAVNSGQWYQIEIDHTGGSGAAGGSHSALAWVDRVAQPTCTVTTTNGTGALGVGIVGNEDLDGSGTHTLDIFVDDMLYWGYTGATDPPQPTAAYEITDILVPDEEGTHSTAASFTDSSANSPPVDPHLLLDEIPAITTPPSTDYVSQSTIGTGDYIELTISDHAGTGTVFGIYGMVSIDAPGGGITAITVKLVDVNFSSAATNIWSAAFNTSSWVKGPLATRVSSGTAWTTSDVDALLWRFGYSGDVTPNPGVGGMYVEVAWTTTADIGWWGWGVNETGAWAVHD